jgi:Restriction endonuclease
VSALSFLSVDSVRFEELCYDLLHELGYLALSWRKGTPKASSPSDQGRDLEGTFNLKLPDGSYHASRWFMECKHHAKGVPPEALYSLISWAHAEKPDYVLVICSGFLSNQAKNWLEEIRQGRPAFDIRVWEFKDLERLFLGRAHLLKRYGIAPGSAVASILHPAHLFLLEHPFISIGVNGLISVLDGLDFSDVRHWLYPAFMAVINPGSLCNPEDALPDQTLGELLDTPITIHEFKRTLTENANVFNEAFLVTSIIHYALSFLLQQGNVTALAENETRLRRNIDYLESEISNGKKDVKVMQPCLHLVKNSLDNLEERLRDGYAQYTRFCETVLPAIYTEEGRVPPISFP